MDALSWASAEPDDGWREGTDARRVGMMQGKTIHYSAERIIGNGSFGVVFQVGCLL